jgi:hypothetical protein
VSRSPSILDDLADQIISRFGPLAYDDPDEQTLSEDGLKFRLAREGKSRWD